MRKKKDGGVFELRWSSGPVTVALDLKIVSNAGRDRRAAQGQGFRGLRLPQTIVGREHAAARLRARIAATGAGGGAP